MGKNKQVEPYQPDFSSHLGEGQRPAPTGFFGCMQNSIAITILSALVLTLIIGTIWLLSIRATGDATASVFDSIGNIFRGGENITTVDVNQFILGVRQEAWLETARELQQLELYAENDYPGILPGRRSLRYQALVTVTAGIDLQQMTADDFIVDGAVVTVVLPPAQLKDCILDEATSRYYDRSCSAAGMVDIGCGGLEEVLRQQAMQTAATENTDRLLEEAFASGAEYIQNLGRNFGFSEILIERQSAALPTVANGGTCYTPPPPTATPPPN